MDKNRLSRGVLGIGVLVCAVAAAPQDEPAPVPVRLSVASLQRQDREFRVTLRGRMEVKDGTLVLVQLLPRIYQLAGDGQSLVLVSTELGAVACRAKAGKGTFTAVLQASRPHEHEARVTSLSGDALPQSRRVVLFDPGSAEGRQRKEIALFKGCFKAVEELISEVEPYAGSSEPAPEKILHRVREVKEKVLSWVETTDLAAAGSVLVGMLYEIGITIPREIKVDPSQALRYASPPKSEGFVLNVEKIKEGLHRAEQIALRESLLRILAPLAEFIDSTAPPEEGGRKKDARPPVKTLRDLLASLESGELAEAARAYAPLREVGPLFSDFDALFQALPEPLDSESLEKLKTLADRLSTLREAVAR